MTAPLRAVVVALCCLFGAGACARGNEPQLAAVLQDRRDRADVHVAGASHPTELGRPARRAFAISPPRFVVPSVTRLASGVTVVLAPLHDFPTVSASFVLDRGRCSGGVAADLHALALGGDPEDEARTNHRYLYDIAAPLHVAVHADMTVAHVHALSLLAAPAIRTVGPFFLRPRPSKTDLEGARKWSERISSVESTRFEGRPFRVGARILFGETGYGTSFGAPTTVELAQTSDADVAAYREAALSPEHTTVIVVGDFEPHAILRTLADATANGDRSKGWRPPTCIGDAHAGPLPTEVVVVDQPGARQARISVLARGVHAGHPDAAALDVLAASMGRALTSRLSLEIREKAGWSYGIDMSAHALRHAGLVSVSGDVEHSRATEALTAILRELARVGSEPPRDDELARAKERAAAVPTTHAQIAAQLAHASGVGQGFDYPEKMHRAIMTVTSDDIARVAATYLTRDKLVLVVEGDATTLVPRLEAAQFETKIGR